MAGYEGTEIPIIRVRGLHKYFGRLHVIKGVDLDVRTGEVVAIMGPSGSGKSTFLRCLNFLETPSAGSIEVGGVQVKAGQPINQQNHRILEIRQKALMVFQEFNLFPHMTVLGNIIEAPVTVKGLTKEQATARADELLTQMGISEKRDEYPSRLSSGQQQRVAIARSLCLEPRIMLFDSPTSMLDVELVDDFIEIIEELAHGGITVVIVTHRVRVARRVADRVILMDDGEWIEISPPEALFDNPKEERTRQFLAKIS
jgi:ABC-type polar amino acid transport system ATPase subunit